MKKTLAIMLALIMVLAMVPALAEGVKVAKIGSTEYETLDEAIEKAADGATIVLLADCTTAGMNLSKNLTIDGGEAKRTISFNDKGIALWGKSLTFKNCNVVMNGIGSTPYTAEWNWMAVCASKDASLMLENTEMTMIGAEGNNAHAIYFCSNNKLNLTNSKLEIKNYKQDALEWNGGDGGYNVNITNSTFISDHNRSGFTGTFYATIDNSTVKVINSLGNGSNGTYYTIKNESDVLFDGNGAWGISAWRIDMSNKSTLTATNNGYSGVWTRVLNVDPTCTLDVEGNGTKALNSSKNPGIFFQGNDTYKSIIEKGANVTIKNNAGAGIYTKQAACNLTINAAAVITNNGTGAVNKDKIGADMGGGIYNVGTIVLCPEVELYNNHAAKAGDDIYNAEGASIAFGGLGSDWWLDGAPDCDGKIHKIDGWYEDGMPGEGDAIGKRWCGTYDGNVCVSNGEAYMESMQAGEYETKIALKAAHGAQTTPPVPTPYNGGGGYYYPTTTPVPVIVIPPKTGDMTVWQSILHFLGIR